MQHQKHYSCVVNLVKIFSQLYWRTVLVSWENLGGELNSLSSNEVRFSRFSTHYIERMCRLTHTSNNGTKLGNNEISHQKHVPKIISLNQSQDVSFETRACGNRNISHNSLINSRLMNGFKMERYAISEMRLFVLCVATVCVVFIVCNYNLNCYERVLSVTYGCGVWFDSE